jgi:sRNA-binding regulator protein Hfq
VNRKLIRPTLAEIKEKGREVPHKEQASNGETPAAAVARVGGGSGSSTGSGVAPVPPQRPSAATPGASSSPSPTGGGGSSSSSSAPHLSSGRSKRIPPAETYAEIFYYKKQMDAHTPMIIVLQDGEEIEGTIEWYDRDALKVNRRSAPNILLLKHNIKYMYKAEERGEAK